MDELPANHLWTTAYGPSWLVPRCQSTIHVYVFEPDAAAAVRLQALQSLSAPGNPVREAHPIPLKGVLGFGEQVLVDMFLDGFKIGVPEPARWGSSYLRFLISLTAPADLPAGIHRAILSIRRALGGTLAELELAVEVRRPISTHKIISGGTMMVAAALSVATAFKALPPMVGLPVSAACFVGGISATILLQEPAPAPDLAPARSLTLAMKDAPYRAEGGLLVQNDILGIYASALHLCGSRPPLLAGLPLELAHGIPAGNSPKEQILLDLFALNQLRARLPDGQVPLQCWLKNAIVLAEPRCEATTLATYLRGLSGAPHG